MTIGESDRSAMVDTVRRLLGEYCGQEDVRRVMAQPSGHDARLWQAMAEAGMPGLIVPQEHGGLGGGAQEVEAVAEAAGAALLGGAFMSSAVLAAGLVAASSDEGAKRRLLPAIASGGTIATAALTGDAGSWTADGIAATCSIGSDGPRLSGSASFVTFAGIAEVIVVIARTPAGPAGFEVGADAAGLRLAAQTCWDPTLRLSRLDMDDVAATAIEGLDAVAIERAMDLARVWLAGEQAGAARRIFEITLDYLKTRVQFGRPIGGFQALKHMAADLLVEVESATSAARAAARALALGEAGSGALVSLASFACADAFGTVSAAAIQMHGGIAFTWEHPAHLYWRRAGACAQLFGNSDFHRDRYLSARAAA